MWIGSTLPLHELRGGSRGDAARHEILSDLFPDVGESAYENWDLQQGDVLQSLMDQRVRAAPDETQHIWKLDGPLEDVPNDEIPSMAWQHMAHTGPLPPIWDLLDRQPSAETLHLLNLVEFTDLLNGCEPDAFVWNAFVILRMVATAHYLHLKSQELHEALKEVHVTIGEEADERVRLREEIPAIDARLAEWDAGQLRDQIGLIQQPWPRPTRKWRTWTIG